jgi:hypothetical protein
MLGSGLPVHPGDPRGILVPGRVFLLVGCSCDHEDWEHATDRSGCIVCRKKCKGWLRDIGAELI